MIRIRLAYTRGLAFSIDLVPRELQRGKKEEN